MEDQKSLFDTTNQQSTPSLESTSLLANNASTTLFLAEAKGKSSIKTLGQVAHALLGHTGKVYDFYLTDPSLIASIRMGSDALRNAYASIVGRLTAYSFSRRDTWRTTAFYHNDAQVALLSVQSGVLRLFLAINPYSQPFSTYFQHDASGYTAYLSVPTMVEIQSEYALENALRLVDILAESYHLALSLSTEDVLSALPIATKEELCLAGLICPVVVRRELLALDEEPTKVSLARMHGYLQTQLQLLTTANPYLESQSAPCEGAEWSQKKAVLISILPVEDIPAAGALTEQEISADTTSWEGADEDIDIANADIELEGPVMQDDAASKSETAELVATTDADREDTESLASTENEEEQQEEPIDEETIDVTADAHTQVALDLSQEAADADIDEYAFADELESQPAQAPDTAHLDAIRAILARDTLYDHSEPECTPSYEDAHEETQPATPIADAVNAVGLIQSALERLAREEAEARQHEEERTAYLRTLRHLLERDTAYDHSEESVEAVSSEETPIVPLSAREDDALSLSANGIDLIRSALYHMAEASALAEAVQRAEADEECAAQERKGAEECVIEASDSELIGLSPDIAEDTAIAQEESVDDTQLEVHSVGEAADKESIDYVEALPDIWDDFDIEGIAGAQPDAESIEAAATFVDEESERIDSQDAEADIAEDIEQLIEEAAHVQEASPIEENVESIEEELQDYVEVLPDLWDDLDIERVEDTSDEGAIIDASETECVADIEPVEVAADDELIQAEEASVETDTQEEEEDYLELLPDISDELDIDAFEACEEATIAEEHIAAEEVAVETELDEDIEYVSEESTLVQEVSNDIEVEPIDEEPQDYVEALPDIWDDFDIESIPEAAESEIEEAVAPTAVGDEESVEPTDIDEAVPDLLDLEDIDAPLIDEESIDETDILDVEEEDEIEELPSIDDLFEDIENLPEDIDVEQYSEDIQPEEEDYLELLPDIGDDLDIDALPATASIAEISADELDIDEPIQPVEVQPTERAETPKAPRTKAPKTKETKKGDKGKKPEPAPIPEPKEKAKTKAEVELDLSGRPIPAELYDIPKEEKKPERKAVEPTVAPSTVIPEGESEEEIMLRMMLEEAEQEQQADDDKRQQIERRYAEEDALRRPLAELAEDEAFQAYTTFERKLFATSALTRAHYSTLKNALLSYIKVRNKIANAGESFRQGSRLIARITLNNDRLRVHLNLDPDAYNASQYGHYSLAKHSAYAEVPFTLDIDDEDGLATALALVVDAMESNYILYTNPKYIEQDYAVLYTLTADGTPRFPKETD